MNDSIKLAIDRLYDVFSLYKIEDFAKVSCFDYGPSAEELEGISKDLRDIPTQVLNSMEFYEEGWSSWGTMNEVKYFLPRLLEVISEDINQLEDPGYFSLFKYKLLNCFSVANKDWSDKEKSSLKDFFDALLEYYFSESTEIGYLIECLLALDMSPDEIVSKWKYDEKLHKDQVINLFKHFNRADKPYYPCYPNGVYFNNSERIEKFLDYVYLQLTLDELAILSC